MGVKIIQVSKKGKKTYVLNRQEFIKYMKNLSETAKARKTVREEIKSERT